MSNNNNSRAGEKRSKAGGGLWKKILRGTRRKMRSGGSTPDRQQSAGTNQSNTNLNSAEADEMRSAYESRTTHTAVGKASSGSACQLVAATPDSGPGAGMPTLAIPTLLRDDLNTQLTPEIRHNVQKWVLTACVEKGVHGLCEEFKGMRRAVSPDLYRAFSQQPPGTRNRYKDVVCLDNCRVKLRDPQNDYIHANFVGDCRNPRRFICTQGPNEQTCAEFWQMVVQERAQIIIMLCNFEEKRMPKCSQYYPRQSGQVLQFGPFSVRCAGASQRKMNAEYSDPSLVINFTQLSVNGPNGMHFVNHFHWVDWPDRGVPPPDLSVVQLLEDVQQLVVPAVVHCSAGIGRTGSLVMVSNVLELFRCGLPFDSSGEILRKIREQRAASIQNEAQYLYVHRVVLEYFSRKGLLNDRFFQAYQQQLKTFMSDYVAATSAT